MKDAKRDKVIIFSAPSGSGKSTIVGHLLRKYPFLEFSISATSRAPRGEEQHGREYYFYTPKEFIELVKDEAFVEHEEVYSGQFYGTLHSEVERIWKKGHVILFDIDVKGGVNLKKLFGEKALAVFVKAPSLEALRERLMKRQTDSIEEIEKRIAKAEEESSYERYFDVTLINNNLDEAFSEAEKIIENFIKS